MLAGENLDAADTGWVMDTIMAGEATSAQVAGFAVALRAKGETAVEVAGLVDSMLSHAVRVDRARSGRGHRRHRRRPREHRQHLDDGRGGDRRGRSAGGQARQPGGVEQMRCGRSAGGSRGGDLAARRRRSRPPSTEVGIGFCFAPVYHPSFRHAGAARRELGIPTVFNFLGPLTNPAQPAAGAIGCGNPRMAPVMAEVFALRGVGRAVVPRRRRAGRTHHDDDLDGLGGARRARCGNSPSTREMLGIERSDPADLRGGDVARTWQSPASCSPAAGGPVRDAVVLNAAAGLAAHAGLTGDLLADLRTGVARARAALDSGAAADVLDRWVAAGRSDLRQRRR